MDDDDDDSSDKARTNAEYRRVLLEKMEHERREMKARQETAERGEFEEEQHDTGNTENDDVASDDVAGAKDTDGADATPVNESGDSGSGDGETRRGTKSTAATSDERAPSTSIAEAGARPEAAASYDAPQRPEFGAAPLQPALGARGDDGGSGDGRRERGEGAALSHSGAARGGGGGDDERSATEPDREINDESGDDGDGDGGDGSVRPNAGAVYSDGDAGESAATADDRRVLATGAGSIDGHRAVAVAATHDDHQVDVRQRASGAESSVAFPAFGAVSPVGFTFGTGTARRALDDGERSEKRGYGGAGAPDVCRNVDAPMESKQAYGADDSRGSDDDRSDGECATERMGRANDDGYGEKDARETHTAAFGGAPAVGSGAPGDESPSDEPTSVASGEHDSRPTRQGAIDADAARAAPDADAGSHSASRPTAAAAAAAAEDAPLSVSDHMREQWHEMWRGKRDAAPERERRPAGALDAAAPLITAHGGAGGERTRQRAAVANAADDLEEVRALEAELGSVAGGMRQSRDETRAFLARCPNQGAFAASLDT